MKKITKLRIFKKNIFVRSLNDPKLIKVNGIKSK